jgi:hypothetical protein
MTDELDTMLDEKFDRFALGLFKYLDNRFAEVGDRFDRLELRVSKLEGAVDAIGKNQEIDRQERMVLNHQMTRYEGWAQRLAKKAGIKLSYE